MIINPYVFASGSALDPDAQAFITAASITNPTQQSAINQLVLDLKGYNIWSKMKALYPFVGGTASTHKYNLKNPLDTDAAFRIVWSGGVTHSSNGVQFNGTNSYGDTKLKPSILTNSSAHHSFYLRTAFSNYEGHGCVDPSYSTRMDIIENGFGQPLYSAIGVGGAAQASTTVTPFKSLILGSRTLSTSNKLYVGNVLRDTKTSSSTVNLPNYNYFIGSVNQSSGGFYSAAQCAFASIGDGLTDTEAANLYTAVQAFQTTLSRNV